ncbi:class II aldolase [Natranaerobius trueperi]|uniref:Class II aldolase n=2 Tax=Natranaerobius trueperi TaxID=759412 RepID=A0A226C311_9FIRM|nr:class II aldolase [Natranaerobius trueperi]
MNTCKKVLEVSKKMASLGLIQGTWGNVSARVKTDKGEYITITPSGMDYEKMKVEDMVILDASGNVISGTNKPSSEYRLHLGIYKHRKDINGIVHTHSPYSTAMAISHTEIPPACEDLVQVIGGSVSVASYAHPGTVKLSENVVFALSDKMAVLLANHGLVSCGRTLEEALKAAQIVEKSAMATVYAKLFGGAIHLPKKEIEKMRDFYVKSYGKPI